MDVDDAAPHGQCDAGLVRAFSILGKRWNGLILSMLATGPVKFSDLRRRVGAITDSMLADRLNELVAEGTVERLESDDRPTRISYQLTPKGVALLPILNELATWAGSNLAPAR